MSARSWSGVRVFMQWPGRSAGASPKGGEGACRTGSGVLARRSTSRMSLRSHGSWALCLNPHPSTRNNKRPISSRYARPSMKATPVALPRTPLSTASLQICVLTVRADKVLMRAPKPRRRLWFGTARFLEGSEWKKQRSRLAYESDKAVMLIEGHGFVSFCVDQQCERCCRCRGE